MSTPPLSPRPRRWAPEGRIVETLHSLVEKGSPGPMATPSAGDNMLSPKPALPYIKTTSPSPQRGVPTVPTATAPPSPTAQNSALAPQQTGGSLAARYDDVFAQIDALANPNTFSLSLPPPPSGTTTPVGAPSPPRSPTRSPRSSPHASQASPTRESSYATPMSPLTLSPSRSPQLSPHGRTTPRSPLSTESPIRSRFEPTALYGLGINMPRTTSEKSAVSHSRSEPIRSEHHSSISSSPGKAASTPRSPVATRFPFAPKSPAGPARTPRRSAMAPTSASALIKMFESKVDNTGSPGDAISPPSEKKTDVKPLPSLPPRSTGSSDNEPTQTTRQTPSPPKASNRPRTPVRNLRSAIASWQARTASGSKNLTEDVISTTGAALPRDSSWNVSIRRRRKNESTALAEQILERSLSPYPIPPPSPSAAVSLESRLEDNASQLPPSALATFTGNVSASEATSLTRQPIRVGTLFYFNVHQSDREEDWKWVEVDAHLYEDGLSIKWRDGGDQAEVNFGLEYCEGESL